jgi:hypothetical protein
MKSFIGVLLLTFVAMILSATIYSCNYERPKPEVYPKYKYAIDDYLSDSAKIKMATWITETVKATNNQMTGGDYEDPEDVIEQLEETGKRLFSVRIEGLSIQEKQDGWWTFTAKPELTKNELVILDSLKNQ